MKKYLIILMMALLPTLVLASQTGQLFTFPKPTTTKSTQKKTSPKKTQTVTQQKTTKTTTQKSKVQATPKKPAVQTKKQTVTKKQNTVELKPVETVSSPGSDAVQPQPAKPQEKESVKDKHVFKSVEQMPSYPGGDAALLEDLAANLQYPASAIEQGTQGRVVVQMVVCSDGSIGEVKIVRSLSPECDRAAISAVKQLKRFYPGRQNGKEVNVWYTLPVTFKLTK